jgi:hypothetical protein
MRITIEVLGAHTPDYLFAGDLMRAIANQFDIGADSEEPNERRMRANNEVMTLRVHSFEGTEEVRIRLVVEDV